MFRLCSKDVKMVKVTSFQAQSQSTGSQTSSQCGPAQHNSRLFSTKGGKSVNHYKILGVSTESSSKDIKKAFYRISKVYHPDVNKAETAVQQFQMISEAYEVLSNDLTRKQYDLEMGIIKSQRPLRHGQERYKFRGTPPTGMSSTYNFDEWYRKHYSETFHRTMDDKRKTANFEEELRAEVKEAYRRDAEREKEAVELSKSLYLVVGLVTLAFILKTIINPK